jgi:hypothetical protein
MGLRMDHLELRSLLPNRKDWVPSIKCLRRLLVRDDG